MNAAKTASRRNLLSMLTLTKRIANAIAKTIERINNTIERFSLSIQSNYVCNPNEERSQGLVGPCRLADPREVFHMK